jgi:hypothetical protein
LTYKPEEKGVVEKSLTVWCEKKTSSQKDIKSREEVSY